MEPNAHSTKEDPNQEVERRFVVTLKAKEALLKRYLGTSRQVAQGYADTVDDMNMRVRVMTYYLDARMVAYLTVKSGSGTVRREIETPIDPVAAGLMLAEMRLRLVKRRYYIDTFEVDAFEGELDGLVLLEREYNPDEVERGLHLQPLQQPDWVESWTEVTDSLSNLHLARLALDRRIAGTQNETLPMPPRRLPQFVVTGGPGSGKTTLMEAVRHSVFAKAVRVVPEVATVVIQQLGVKPPIGDAAGMVAFQRTLARTQQIFEAESNRAAAREGLKAVILDRGLVDNAAYLDGGLKALSEIVGVSPSHLALPYRGVIVMSPPPPEVYEQVKGNNPARSEDHARAKALGESVYQLWKQSPSSVPVVHITENSSWAAKLAHAMGVLEGFLRQD